MGWIFVQFGQPEKGVQLINSSVRARPADPTFRYHLGVAYLDAGDLDAGRAALEEAIRLGPFPEQEEAQRRLQMLELSPAPSGVSGSI
jgi:Flp pilus assembly protein TadD